MNSDFSIQDTKIKDVKLITPFYVEDERGYFLKSVEREIFGSWGLNSDIYEDFESYSKQGVIRGMHFQTREPQIKLVRAIYGTVHDIVVDLRKNSETFGKYVDIILSDQNHISLWVPAGFAHGFEVLSETAIVSYKCVGKYLKDHDTGIRWNDEDLKLPWKTEMPIVSDKDVGLMSFAEYIESLGGNELALLQEVAA